MILNFASACHYQILTASCASGGGLKCAVGGTIFYAPFSLPWGTPQLCLFNKSGSRFGAVCCLVRRIRPLHDHHQTPVVQSTYCIWLLCGSFFFIWHTQQRGAVACLVISNSARLMRTKRCGACTIVCKLFERLLRASCRQCRISESSGVVKVKLFEIEHCV